MSPKQVIAYCYEGLCNRIDTLIAASFLAKRYKCPLSIFWVDKQLSMDVAVTDLFSNINCTLLPESEFDTFIKNNSKDIFAMSRNISNIGTYTRLYSCENFNCNVELEQIDNIQQSIIFIQTCTIPPWCMHYNAIQTFYEYFTIRPELIKPPLGKIAIHIRGTDMFEDLHIKGASVNKAIEFAKQISIEHPNEKIFICSDDEEIEKKLKDISSLFVMFDKSYVHKRDKALTFNNNLDKNGLIYSYSNLDSIEYNGKEYKNITQTNMVREKEHVHGAITDLFAMAQVEHLYGYETSRLSTFFFLASLLKTTRCLPLKKTRQIL